MVVRNGRKSPANRKREVAAIMIVGFRKLWLERNARVFEGKEATAHMVVSGAVEELKQWCLARQKVAGIREE